MRVEQGGVLNFISAFWRLITFLMDYKKLVYLLTLIFWSDIDFSMLYLNTVYFML